MIKDREVIRLGEFPSQSAVSIILDGAFFFATVNEVRVGQSLSSRALSAWAFGNGAKTVYHAYDLRFER